MFVCLFGWFFNLVHIGRSVDFTWKDLFKNPCDIYMQNKTKIQFIFVAFTALQSNFHPFNACMYTESTKSEMLKKILW